MPSLREFALGIVNNSRDRTLVKLSELLLQLEIHFLLTSG